jgi:hypothetical protein
VLTNSEGTPVLTLVPNENLIYGAPGTGTVVPSAGSVFGGSSETRGGGWVVLGVAVSVVLPDAPVVASGGEDTGGEDAGGEDTGGEDTGPVATGADDTGVDAGAMVVVGAPTTVVDPSLASSAEPGTVVREAPSRSDSSGPPPSVVASGIVVRYAHPGTSPDPDDRYGGNVLRDDRLKTVPEIEGTVTRGTSVAGGVGQTKPSGPSSNDTKSA